jgi:hypothetical protein
MGDEEINGDPYGALGDMELDDNGPPFEFMISNKLINNMFHVLLAHNTIHKRVSYEQIKANKLPFDWTST